MRKITLLSYAKVNLTLEVSARREDGFHDIDSVAQVIDIADELSISEAPEGIIDVAVDAPDVPSGTDNLVYKACRAFLDATGACAGARFTLRKSIPVQAGLGGGSSNAAAAVAGLDRLYQCGFSRRQLAAIAAEVGSDAALFVSGGCVRMGGRGEQVRDLPDAPALDIVVLKPDVGVSTAWAYAELDRTGPRKPRGASDAAERAVREGDRAALVRGMWNDFDPVVSRAVPVICKARRLLMAQGAENVLLAGSGSAVFGVFASPDAARATAEALQPIGKAFVARSLTRRESSLADNGYGES